MSASGSFKLGRPGAAPIVAVLAAVLLSACVSQGDFGRIEPSNINRYLGYDVYGHVPGFAGIRESVVPLTADESEMRARAYTLVYRNAHTQTNDHWTEPNRFISNSFPSGEFPNAKAYSQTLAAARFRSPEARSNAIGDDIRADLAGIDAFQRAALSVYAADATRLLDLDRVATSDKVGQSVSVRIAQNRQIVEQTLVALTEKIAGYELALGDVIVIGALNSRAGAAQELENIKRRFARLEAELRHIEGRYAMTLPREPQCLNRSIARTC